MINYDFTYNELLYFLLIFVRVASFVFVAPFFSMGNTPARIRAGLSFFITLLLYHTLPETEIVYNGLLEYTVIVMKEVVTGLLLGFGTNFCTSIMSFAGQIVDMILVCPWRVCLIRRRNSRHPYQVLFIII